MGRELKMVPLDFDYPIGQLWKGYVNPYRSQQCKSCDATGLNKETKALQDEWYSFSNERYLPNPFRKGLRYNANAWNNNLEQEDVQALIDAGRLYDFTRVPVNEEQKKIVDKKIKDGGNSWLPFNNGYVPTAAEVNEWNLKGLGHDSLNCWICVKAKAKRLGVWGYCPYCEDGEIWTSEEIKKLSENWESFDPPEGEGFQLWNTTTEGHPMSPVFKTLELLCEYLEKENVSVFGSNTATKEEWISMLSDGCVYYKQGNKIFV